MDGAVAVYRRALKRSRAEAAPAVDPDNGRLALELTARYGDDPHLRDAIAGHAPGSPPVLIALLKHALGRERNEKHMEHFAALGEFGRARSARPNHRVYI